MSKITETVEAMDVETLSRYASLFEAIDLIDMNCKKYKTDFKKIKFNVVGLKKYVNDTHKNHAKRLQDEHLSQKLQKIGY